MSLSPCQERGLLERLFARVETPAARWADMRGHMATLAMLASRWTFAGAVELGVGKGCSTQAFLTGMNGHGRLVSYDRRDCRGNVLEILGDLPEIVAPWEFREKESIAAADDWPDASLSFVFIDTSHTYEQTRDELRAWGPKVRPDGILAGHDYQLREYVAHDGKKVVCGVDRAVDEYADAHPERRLQVLPHDQGVFVLWPRNVGAEMETGTPRG